MKEPTKNVTRKRVIILCSALALCALIVGAVILFSYLDSVSRYQEQVRTTVISDVDVSSIPDGSYIGEYDVQFIYAKVDVRVHSGKITEVIILEHRNDRGMTAESIVDSIVTAQTLDVDAVSGATNSSTVLRKAVELALLSAG